ncbi:MAG: ATP-binding protein [Mycobacteriales bacterium]
MSRLPIRWKVTAAFALSLLVVLASLGAFIYVRFDGELSRSLDRGLQVRAGEVGTLVAKSQLDGLPVAASAFDAEEHVVQVLGLDGTVLAGTTPNGVALLNGGQLDRAQGAQVFVDRPGDAAIDEHLRLLAAPVRRADEMLIVVVGSSLEDKGEALGSLLILSLIGLGSALALTSIAGYVVAGIALRPVEAMRVRAAGITDQPDVRLPVPPVDDELGRLGRTLNAMLERLDTAQQSERAMLARDRRFVEDASHELRTPLTVLKSELEVALIGERPVGELRAAVLSALEETDRLVGLGDDLLLLAQSDQQELHLHRERCDVADLLATVAARSERQPAARGREIRVVAAAGTELSADRARLEQALHNLVDNALRHGAGEIELTALRYVDHVDIGVRDHGAGFAPGFADRAFERFSRADAGRTGGGTGLGLSIVQAVAHAHGASVVLSSASPGALVTIRFPAP